MSDKPHPATGLTSEQEREVIHNMGQPAVRTATARWYRDKRHAWNRQHGKNPGWFPPPHWDGS